jgi:hypothetical protein
MQYFSLIITGQVSMQNLFLNGRLSVESVCLSRKSFDKRKVSICDVFVDRKLNEIMELQRSVFMIPLIICVSRPILCRL